LIPYGRQNITIDDINAVVDVLKSDFLTQGPCVPKFEESIINYCSSTYALAVNSATSALHIACLALEVKPGDHVWTSPITFVASANCAVYCGADVDFVDIHKDTYNMDVNILEKKLLQAKKNNCLPKVVIPVHLSGQSCEMDKIYELSKEYNFKIIEDASHSIGSKYKNNPVGDCKYSDITVFSFHPVKIITTAEGGVAVTNDNDLYNKMKLYRSHGITRDEELMENESDGPWYYEQVCLGLNYRMTDIQAALGLSQMKRLDKFVQKRHQIAQLYDEAFKDLPVKIPFQHPDNFSSFHLYPIRIKSECVKSHLNVFNELLKNGIGVNLHYIPVYRQPYYKKLGYKKENFPQSELYYKQAISIPMFPDLNTKMQQKVIDTIREVISN
jgi:UDP-4-amino-4,6-dideoxy-N-acetyl-beta-L-altrosamine transaminase